MTAPPMDIITAIRDPNMLGDELSVSQEVALRALYGLDVADSELELARECLGPSWKPGQEYREAAYICGRRSGKSDKLAANVAIFEAFFRSHRLSAGETGVVLLLAQNMRQAKVVKGYVDGKINRSPVLRRHVIASRAQELQLDNGITIAIHPASFRAIRGLSVVCCICDEIAFWWNEEGYANPDVEVVRAIRPAMATFPNAKLLFISSPYAKTGVLWDLWRNRESDAETLVWRASTSVMSPTVPTRFLKREETRDPENFRREYLAEFTDAVSAFLSSEAIEACVVRDRKELPPDPNRHNYVAAIDAAFKGDRFTLCIGHYDRDEDRVVIDLLRGWQGSPREPVQFGRDVLPAIKALDEQYGFRTIHADQFGAQPLKEAFERRSLYFEEHPFTNASKADMYAEVRTRVAECTIELLDHEQSLRELRGLQLELLPGGGTRIGHAGHGKARDDFADAMALVISQCRYHLAAAEVAVLGDTRESYLLANYDRLRCDYTDVLGRKRW